MRSYGSASFGSLLVGIVAFFPRKGELYQAMYLSVFDKRATLLLDEGIDGLIGTYQEGDRVLTFINGSAHGGRPGYNYYYETIEAMSRTPKSHKGPGYRIRNRLDCGNDS